MRHGAIGAIAGGVLGAIVGAIGGGLAVLLGLVAGVLVGGLAGVAAAAAGGSLGGPRREITRRGRIDPFTVTDPWRRLTQRALASRDQFAATVKRTTAGPVRDRLADIGREVDGSVDEIWATALAGHELTRAYSQLDVPSTKRQLAALGDSDAERSEAAAATADALRSQLATADRMAATIETTRDRLQLLDARLDEVVARAVELSVGAYQPDAFSQLEVTVGSISDELEALRSALVETQEIERGAGEQRPSTS